MSQSMTLVRRNPDIRRGRISHGYWWPTRYTTTRRRPTYTQHLWRRLLGCWRSAGVEQSTVLVATRHQLLRTIQTTTENVSVRN